MEITHAQLKKASAKLVQADLVFYIMPALIALLVIGTVAQAEMGLYAAHQKYFSSFIFWQNIWTISIPLPGGYLLLGLLTICLTFKFLLKSDWSWKKSGIILSHLGALILLIGGLLTAITAEEKYMIIPEGDQTPYIYDYHNRELLIYAGNTLKAAIPFKNIKVGKPLPVDLPFQLNVTGTFENVNILRREESPEFDENIQYQGLAQFMAFTPKPKSKDPEADLTSLNLEIIGAGTNENGDDQDGAYITFDGAPKSIDLTVDDQDFTILFGKQQSTLPFSIRLIDFQKETYDGIDLARSYASEVMIVDGALEWPVKIEMNKPLRYKNYTFFQSSFERTPEHEITILSVVRNTGWLFPYIGTAVLGIGLLLHLILAIRERKA